MKFQFSADWLKLAVVKSAPLHNLTYCVFQRFRILRQRGGQVVAAFPWGRSFGSTSHATIQKWRAQKTACAVRSLFHFALHHIRRHVSCVWPRLYVACVLSIWTKTFGKGKVKWEGAHASSLLAAGRAELRRTQLTWSGRRHVEGAAGCRLTTQCYGAQLGWKGCLSVYLGPQPTLSTFQVGGNQSTKRKPTTFNWQSVN